MNCLRQLEHWGRGFEIRTRHGCLYCVYLFCVCVVPCTGRGLATGWSPVQGIVPTVYRFEKLKKLPRPNRGLYKHNNLSKFCGLSPQANYTDRATAACRRSYWPFWPIEGVAWSPERIPTAVNLNCLDAEPLLFHSSSSSIILTRLSGPRSRLTTSQKSVVAPGIDPGTFGSVARSSEH
jgi:hypothetical protein